MPRSTDYSPDTPCLSSCTMGPPHKAVPTRLFAHASHRLNRVSRSVLPELSSWTRCAGPREQVWLTCVQMRWSVGCRGSGLHAPRYWVSRTRSPFWHDASAPPRKSSRPQPGGPWGRNPGQPSRSLGLWQDSNQSSPWAGKTRGPATLHALWGRCPAPALTISALPHSCACAGPLRSPECQQFSLLCGPPQSAPGDER